MSLVEVTQADRDAAAAYLGSGGLPNYGMIAAIREGRNDENSIVQAFARHRIAALSSREDVEAFLRQFQLEATSYFVAYMAGLGKDSAHIESARAAFNESCDRTREFLASLSQSSGDTL